MKTIKTIGLFVCLIVILLASIGHSRETTKAARVQSSTSVADSNAAVQQYKELSFFFNGRRWIQGGTQCDAGDHVTIITPFGGPRSIDMITFPKSQPTRKARLKLRQKGDDDCGMMKCYSTYVAPGARYVILESHYLDDEAYWTRQYHIGKGRKAEANLEECRWFERTHAAVITEMRSIYVTESEAGELEYKSFNHKEAAAEPSVSIKGGKRELDTTRGVEIFTFNKGEYAYVVTISTTERRPFAEVRVEKNGATIQRERCLIYTYAKKS